MLRIENLAMHFADVAVIHSLTLTVRSGEFVAVLGPSGCGKTTLLRLAAGVLHPSAGTIGNSFRRSAFVFQDARLAGWMTALENAGFGLKAAGMARSARETAATRILLRLGLETADLAKRPHALSGGMRQRVGLARALAVAPDLLLLDEPFSALDVGLRRDMQRLIRNEVDTAGIAALLVTHDVAEAVRLADRIVVLSPRPGRIVAELLNHPCDDEALMFESAAKLLRTPGVEQALLRTGPPRRQRSLTYAAEG
ncbi:ABC transporter ATP-binding protein [Bradyrhizobium sp. SZCCHNR1075]|uniref:ABC transporter ATP-binding protein n=1 Tax=Bradyrhizobium sp. SZCCHNR1075 TaxID=3057362 RepID=UPI0028EBB613|nr:ATP-binding cassette domain-containing protein [Bradyrhizobium sp. SZCCHNR1075]